MTAKEIADRFRAMAARIEKNADEPFGGCYIIIPPGDEAQPMEMLKLDGKSDGAIFWGEINSKAAESVQELTNAARNVQAGFRR